MVMKPLDVMQNVERLRAPDEQLVIFAVAYVASRCASASSLFTSRMSCKMLFDMGAGVGLASDPGSASEFSTWVQQFKARSVLL